MIRTIRHGLLLLLAAIILNACGELIELGTSSLPTGGGEVTLPRHEADIMVGDSLTFIPRAVPDSIRVSYYWYLADQADSEHLYIHGPKIKALSVGDVKVYVRAQLLGSHGYMAEYLDSCIVHVFDWRPEILPYEYPYSMIVNCQVDVEGQTVSNNLEMAAVAADGQVRGRPQWQEQRGIRYLTLRVYSPTSYGDSIYFQCYDHTQVSRITLRPSPIIFDGETHGSLSNLLQFTGTNVTRTDLYY